MTVGKEKVIPINRQVNMPSDWWDAIERVAEAEGLSVSKWLANCAMAYLPKGIELSTKNGRGRPKAIEPKKARFNQETTEQWCNACNDCRIHPKEDDDFLCEKCRNEPKKPLAITQDMFCRCDSFADCDCGSLERFTEWQTANPDQAEKGGE